MAIRTSPQTEQLDEAFARAQGKFEAAAKSAANPAYRSRYADISSIIEATLEHLNAEGVGVRQHPALEYKGSTEALEAYITVTTRLAYKGQWEESDLSIPAVQRERFDAQSCGSAITYACRYALQGIFCVRREDDDANSASGVGSKEAAQSVAQEKIAAHKAKKAEEPPIPKDAALFYIWFDESQSAEITGHQALLKLNGDLLRQYWNGNSKSIVVNAEQLEALKYEFERRKVTFSPLKAAKP